MAARAEDADGERLVVGLMSGTSCDGIDAALVRLTGCGTTTRVLKLEHYLTRPWPAALRAELVALFREEATVATLCRLNVETGRLFGAAALELLRAADLSPSDVAFIGSHGQTVRHLPPAPGEAMGSTLQIGEPAVIAAVTGIVTVADFRPADMALGGQGAPLLPWVDHLLYTDMTAGRVLLNLGGIANVTLLPPAARPDDVLAFDTGPGNMCLDLAIAAMTAGAATCDVGGVRAAAGQVDPSLLAQLKAHAFFKRTPPKSTGHEAFGAAFVADVLAQAREARLSEDDVLATLTRFTAETVADAVQSFCVPRCGASRLTQMWVAGGGVHNHTLMAALQTALPDMTVAPFDGLGADPDAREAVAFAILANERMYGGSNTLPGVTGALRAARGGKVCLPPLDA